MFIVLIDAGDYEFSGIGPFETEWHAKQFIKSTVPAVHGPIVVAVETPEQFIESEKES